MLSGKGVVDEKILLVVVHRVSEVHGLDAPAVPIELLYHVIMEVLVVDGVVRAEGRCIVIIDHGLVAMGGIVAAEVLDECRYLAVELDVETLDDIEAAVARLTGDNPVDVCYNIVIYYSIVCCKLQHCFIHILYPILAILFLRKNANAV